MRGPILPPEDRYREEYEEHFRRCEWRKAYRLLGEGMDVIHALQIRFVLEYGAQMPDDDYWYLAWDAYKNAFRGLDLISTEELRRLFTSRPGIERLMSGDERRILAQLGEELTLYRGYHDPDRLYRFSWTTREQNAAYFAILWHDLDGGDPMIAQATVSKQSVLAVWSFEAEALVDPGFVRVDETYPVPERYWVMFGYEHRFRERFGREPQSGHC